MEVTIPILILAIPIAMFLILGIGGVKMSHKTAGFLGICGLGTTAVLSYIVACTYYFSGDPLFIIDGVRQQYQVFDVTWLAFTQNLVVKIGFLLDPISALMLIVITTISFMVHLYSWGYMEGEKDSRDTMHFSPYSLFLCWVLWLQPIYSRCIYSGSSWVFPPIC